MNIIKIMQYLIFLGFTITSFSVFAWDGYDYENGAFVEIDKGNLVRSGQDIEIYDYSTGEFKDVEVESVRSNGSGAEVEVYDPETGDHRSLYMDD